MCCRWRIVGLTFAGLAVAVPTTAQPQPRSVLILDQSDTHSAWYGPFSGAFRSTLYAGSAERIPVYAEHLDLSESDTDRGSFVDRVEAELGPVDILVNNASMGGFHPFLEWTDDEIQRCLEVNLWAPWQLVRRALPGMRARGEGWILNLSSAVARIPWSPRA